MRKRSLILLGNLLFFAAASTVAGCGDSGEVTFTTSGSAGDSTTGMTGGAGTGGAAGAGMTGGAGAGGTTGEAGAGGTTGGAGAGGTTGGTGGATGGTGGMAAGSGGMTTGSGGMTTGSGGMSGAGGMTGSGGTGGGGPLCTPEGVFNGAPVTGNDGQWIWVDVPGAKCRSGSAAGFGVRLNSASDKLFIYFEGGGACFNGVSCLSNSGAYSQNNFNNWKTGGGKSGVFDSSNAANALKDWNAVYIPYCTGDVHAGNATGVNVPGFGSPQNQSFVGFANVGLFLQRIVPTFSSVTKVLVTGVSAGGFGAAFNFHRIAQAFCPTEALLIDDSGPAMADQYLAPCLQDRWRTLWGLNANLPADCANCNPAGGGGILNYMDYLSTRYPGGRLTLISSTEDATIRQFYGFGQNNCANLDGFAQSLPAATYTEGLNDLRMNHDKPPALWASYYLTGTTHTYLGGGGYTSTTSAGVNLIDWVADVVNGGPMVNVGP